MRDNNYILNGKTPVPCRDIYRWGKWFESADRHVAKEMVGHIMVSTVFLGLDHRHFGEGPPILFETMAFDQSQTTPIVELERPDGTICKMGGHHPEVEGCSARYCTWDEAEAGHRKVVNQLRARQIGLKVVGAKMGPKHD